MKRSFLFSVVTLLAAWVFLPVATFHGGGSGAGSTTQPRVVRGGSWYDFAEDCRVTSRDGLNPASWNYVAGFRIVRDAK